MKIRVWEVSEMTLMGESAKYLGGGGEGPPPWPPFAPQKPFRVCVLVWAFFHHLAGTK